MASPGLVLTGQEVPVCSGSMVRAVVGIVAGYVVFAGSAVALFQLARVDPHAPAGAKFTAFSVAYGVVFAGLGGFLAGWLGGRRDSRCGLVLAWIVGTGALISLLASPARAGFAAHWSQFAALGLMAPAAWAGDWLRAKSRRKVRRPGTASI